MIQTMGSKVFRDDYVGFRDLVDVFEAGDADPFDLDPAYPDMPTLHAHGAAYNQAMGHGGGGAADPSTRARGRRPPPDLTGHANKDGRTAFSMGDTDGQAATFEAIARELGFSVAGAKQASDRALVKARFVSMLGDDELEVVVLTAVVGYVKELQRSGELTDDDVRLLKDNPDVVKELDGFREFLKPHVKRWMKRSQSG